MKPPTAHIATGNPEIDQAWRLALGDMRANIGPFQDGLLERPQPCVLAGFDYDTPWTRDAAINVWNGVGLLMPQVARNTLLSVLERRDGRLRIGGQYWDAIIWATGAWAYYLMTGDRPFLALALDVVSNALEFFEATEFNTATGLFRGGSLFNDGISGYPDIYAQTRGRSSNILHWPAAHPALRSTPGYGLPMQALSTNCLYQHAYVVAQQMADELGQEPDRAWVFKAAALKAAINRHFWQAGMQRYSYLVDPFGGCDRQESTGWALAILFGIADEQQRAALLANAHITPAGIPCLWPSYERYRRGNNDYGRHSGTVWPFINAFWAEACVRHQQVEAFGRELFTLARCACRDQQFYEIYHPVTSQPYGGLQERGSPEPALWASCQHQTWSATGFIRMLLMGVAGLRFARDGLRFEPVLPPGIDRLHMSGVRYRAIELDLTIERATNTTTGCLIDEHPAEPFLPAEHSGPVTILLRV